MLEKKSSLVEEIRSSDELQRVIHLEEQLVSLLNLVALANDLIWVRQQLFIPRPITVANIRINQLPIPTIIRRVVCFDVAIVIEVGAILRTRPNEIVGFGGMEMEHFQANTVRWRWSCLFVPCSTSICGVPESLGSRHQIRPIITGRMVVESNEPFLRMELFPGIAFVA